MSLEFVDKQVEDEYYNLMAEEERLLDELEPIQARIREIERTEERE